MQPIGLGVVGSGRIGTLRARLAAAHPAVRSVAVSDRCPEAAGTLAGQVSGRSYGADTEALLADPAVTAVIIATPEGQHLDPLLAAVAAGKRVLVEKPIALTLTDAAQALHAVGAAQGDVRVGYSRRYKERYQIAKEHVGQGRLGTLTGGAARVFNSRAQAFAMLGRDRHATPVVDALTYYVDLMNWLFVPRRVVEVYARGQGGVLRAAGHGAEDVCYAVLTYDDGAVLSLGISYALPARYPALGHAARVELLGTEGVMILDDDHTEQVLYSERGVPHVYLPEHAVNLVFLQSGTPGDWALGEFWGPVANETRAWLDHLATGRPCVLATPEEARDTLEVTLAIEHAMRAGGPVTLPLQAN